MSRPTEVRTHPSLLYKVAFPDAQLRDFVSHFWFSRLKEGVQESLVYHSTASTTTEFVFAFSETSGRPALVFSSAQGHTESYRPIDTGGFSEMFGVSIYSYALPFFFGVSAGEFANQLVCVSELVASDFSEIVDRLEYHSDFASRTAVITSFLKSRFNDARKVDHTILEAIRQIRRKRGQVNIMSMADDSSFSQKQFERRFKEFSGFNPKLYSRILRFESSLYSQENSVRLTDVAYDLGYFDQAHFINDFRQFSGFSPGRYTAITID